MKECLELSDPYQIAFIFLQNPNIENTSVYIVKNGFTYAQVPGTQETNKIIARFNEGALVDAAGFARIIKRVRGQMIQKKNEMRGNGHENRTFS